MWKDLSPEWQTAFEEAWTAFRNGSIPIGAAIYGENGELLVRDRNRAAEPDTVNRYISHAEGNSLRRLDAHACNVRSAVLYTTMEPCPMCMGTAVMSNIRHLRYAARDPYCGFVHLKDSEPYYLGKGLDYTHEGGELELVQLAMQSYFELRNIEGGAGDRVLCCFAELSSAAVEAARAMYAEKLLDRYAADGREMSFVYDDIVRRAGK
jgi:tRNA(adenine34) deaminase